MAIDTLTAARDPANSKQSLDDLAAEIQIQASRVASLAEAIDATLDCDLDTKALGRLIDYVKLIQEAAERARASGEAVEIHAMHAKNGAR
jgi:hypothetical protein